MRILVISDSHGRTAAIDKILSEQPDAEYVFFLGDKTSDIEDFEFIYPQKQFFVVCGNCDYCSSYPSVSVANVCGKRILFTHGHNFSVKYGTQRLLAAAKENNYDIVLFGHTHIPTTLYEDGVYLVNPGSCGNSREGAPSYAVIDITDSGVMPIIIRI